jgi:ribosomal protein S6
METNEQIKKEYVASFLTLEESGARARALVEKSGGEVTHVPEFAKVRLAYPIKKQQFAFSGNIFFNATGNPSQKISAGLKFEPEILRVMVLIKPPVIEEKRQDPEEVARAKARRRGGEKGAPRKFHTELSNEALEKKIEEILQ